MHRPARKISHVSHHTGWWNAICAKEDFIRGIPVKLRERQGTGSRTLEGSLPTTDHTEAKLHCEKIIAYEAIRLVRNGRRATGSRRYCGRL